MKKIPSSLFAAAALPAVLGAALFISAPGLQAQDKRLSHGEIQQLQEKLDSLRMVIENRHSQLNTNAADIFLSASQNPAAAVDLYFKCHYRVNYEWEGREADEFEDWRDNQRERVKDPRFLEGLQTQLRYLALSCKAAEAEDLGEVFPNLLSYGDGLMRLTEMPSQLLLQGVSDSIFAKAYRLDDLLAKNEAWEQIPFNVAGIYEKTVLPYLRENETEKLMSAWDRRVTQQTQMVDFLEALETRGNRRDDRRRSEDEVRQMQGGRSGGIIRAHDRDDFLRNTLPELRLGRLTDLFQYVDQIQGAAGLVAFIEEHIEHERAESWLERISGVLAAGGQTYEPPPTPPPATTSTPPAPSGGGPPPSGKVPPGLVPAN